MDLLVSFQSFRVIGIFENEAYFQALWVSLIGLEPINIIIKKPIRKTLQNGLNLIN